MVLANTCQEIEKTSGILRNIVIWPGGVVEKRNSAFLLTLLFISQKDKCICYDKMTE